MIEVLKIIHFFKVAHLIRHYGFDPFERLQFVASTQVYTSRQTMALLSSENSFKLYLFKSKLFH